MPIKDSLIAATALLHGLTIATRNTRDFSKARVKIVDPFAEGGDQLILSLSKYGQESLSSLPTPARISKPSGLLFS